MAAQQRHAELVLGAGHAALRRDAKKPLRQHAVLGDAIAVAVAHAFPVLALRVPASYLAHPRQGVLELPRHRLVGNTSAGHTEIDVIVRRPHEPCRGSPEPALGLDRISLDPEPV